jgi:hypothetical protein
VQKGANKKTRASTEEQERDSEAHKSVLDGRVRSRHRTAWMTEVRDRRAQVKEGGKQVQKLKQQEG